MSLVVGVGVLASTSVFAQAAPESLRSPELLWAPPVTVSEAELAGAPRDVTLELFVAENGVADVQACDASPLICGRVSAAIARAVFLPASSEARPVSARIAMRFSLSTEAPPAGDVNEPEGPGSDPNEEEPTGPSEPAPYGFSPPAPPTMDAAPVVPPAEEAFGATAMVVLPPAGATRLTLEEARELPGTFGDPFRAIEALPGVVPVLSGIPYFYVRGSPPSGTGYVYDDVPLPALFHLGLGPAVIHPAMVGPIRLYSGVPPARFGRFTGGIVEAEGPDLTIDGVHGEAELRLLDVNGMVQAPVGDGQLAIAGRYGYPGLLLSIFSPNVELQYWDYQSRFSYPITDHDTFEVVALGSFDSLRTTGDNDDPRVEEDEDGFLSIHFHRLEARLRRRMPNFEFGVAVRVGYEDSALDDDLEVRALTTGTRMWLRLQEGDVSLRFGIDQTGARGSIEGDGEGSLGEGEDPQDPTRNALFASVAGRSVSGAFAELGYQPYSFLSLDLGVRADLWISGSNRDAAVDPRLRATFHVRDNFDVHLAGGVAHQAAVFIVPLPGLTDVAIDRGLQTALQAEAGFRWDVGSSISLEAQGFFHRYTGLLLPDLFVGEDACPDGLTVCEGLSEPSPRVDGFSYGAEIFVRRDPSERISGFLSYTLARAEIQDRVEYTPSYDVRHVLNAAARLTIVEGFDVGLRFHLRSGRPLGVFYLQSPELTIERHEQRLPTFYRVDVQVGYAWRTSWGQLRLSLEWFNLTWNREPSDISCPESRLSDPGFCPVEYLPAIVAPNVGLRGTF
ncbi:MAG: TonB-dependent receptor [Myxococcota bacterium]